MAQHLLIASATWKYVDPCDDRPTLPKVLEDIVQLFTKTMMVYTRELEQISENPKSAELTSSLDQWFGDPARDPSDWVVFYYTGHAEIVGAESLYLLTSDFVDGRHVATAFDFQKLADLILSPSKGGRTRQVRNLLVILDTCFAGQGVTDVSSQLATAFRRSSGGSFYLLGAALPRQEAQAGALARALIASIEELSGRSVGQEYLYLDQIVPKINQHLRQAGIVQAAIRFAVDSPLEIPQFFPNRSYLNTDGKPVAAKDAQRAISDQEFRAHWGPRARGVEFDSQPGFYFSGRKAVLDNLVSYLDDPIKSDTVIVTGSPGSGKSAILSRLVNMSVPELHAKWSSRGLGPAIAPFDFALHAKGKTLQETVSRLSEILSVAPTKEAVLDSLKNSARPIRLVVDALDEAAESTRIASELLRPLGSFDSVKLIVGTRIGELDALGDANIIDIDRPENAQREDIVDYVRARLLRRDEPGQATPYAGQEILVNAVASAIAEKAYPNFLVARLIVEGLLSQEQPVNPQNISFPGNVAAAFDLYLSKFGNREKTVRDLLLPLAYAEGQGLPWDDIWAPLARALSERESRDREYSDEDIRWLLTHAGAFILETTENGRSVYRLFHQALAETLRIDKVPVRIQAIFTEVLSATVPDWTTSQEYKTDARGKDWLLASRYIRSYLPTHADACGALSRFLEDPLFLLAANPEQLLAVLAASTKSFPRGILGTYRDIVHRIQDQPAFLTGAYLEMFARKRGLEEFADRITRLPLNRKWEVPWARWTPPAPSKSMAVGEGEVSCLQTAALGDGRKVALVGRQSGAMEVWDMTFGKKLYQWEHGGTDWVKRLALAQVEGRDLLVCAWSDGQLGTFDLTTDKKVIRPVKKKGKDAAVVTALCVTQRQRQSVCITSHDGDYLSIWELPSLLPVLERKRTGAIYDLQIVRMDGQAVLFGAGDSMGDSAELGEGVDWKLSSRNISTLRLLSLDDLSVIWEDGGENGGYFANVSRAHLFGHELVAGYRAGSREVEIWDLGERRFVCSLQVSSGRCWLHRFGEDVVLIWEWGRELGAKRLKATTREGSFFIEGEDFGLPVSVQGDQFTEIVYDQNRPVILSAVLNHVRAWDLDDLLRESLEKKRPVQTRQSEVRLSHVTALRNNPKRPEEFYIGSSNKILAARALDGEILWERELETETRVKQIRVLASGESLVVAYGRGSIHLLDPTASGVTRKVIHTGLLIEAMEIASWKGKSLAFVTGQLGRVWSTRIWDLDSEQEVPTNGVYGLRHGQEDKILRGLAAHVGGKSVRFAFAGQYGKIMVADFDGESIQRLKSWQLFEEWRMPYGAECYTTHLVSHSIKGKVLLAAGNEDGNLAIWDFYTGKLRSAREAAHIGYVNALGFSDSSDRAMMLSAGADGVLRFWTNRLEELFAIETGEPVLDAVWLSQDTVVVGGTGGMMLIRLSDQLSRGLPKLAE